MAEEILQRAWQHCLTVLQLTFYKYNLVLCCRIPAETWGWNLEEDKLKFFFVLLTIVLVVSQSYETDVFKTTVVSGNDAFVKCEIPAHIGDLVGVAGWVDSQGVEIFSSSQGKAEP
jgi:hypothetical protein